MTQSLTRPNFSRRSSTTLKLLTASMLLMQMNAAVAENGNGSFFINNTATSSHSIDNIDFNNTSNEVTATVHTLPIYSVVLSQPAKQIVSPGQQVEWLNILTNNGSYDETVELSFSVPSTLSNFEVYQDLNKNGKIDAGEPSIKDQIKIGQGESIQLIVKALASRDMKDKSTASIEIGATVIEDTSVTANATDELETIAPSIEFMNSSFTSTTTTDQVGQEVYVQTSYAQCNINPNSRDQVWVTLHSTKTKDSYSLKAIETGNNTGIFHLSAPTENNANAVSDNIIQTLQGDVITATLDACIKPSVGINQTPSSNDFINISDKISTNIEMRDNLPSLQVVKTGDVTEAELGDYVNYSIKVTNRGLSTAYDVDLKDALPRGFAYVSGSARVDGKPVADFNAEGKYKVLGLDDLKAGQSKTVTYRVLIGSTAIDGDGINRATAVGKSNLGEFLSSRESQWKVDVSRGVINTDGIIIGKVYNDINRDGIQQKQNGELGVAGVRIYMENGNYAVTDAEGEYNFYGISAKTHVLKVDPLTLPEGVELIDQSNRNAGDPNSLFVDMKYGELHRADFAIIDGMGDTTQRLTDILIERSNTVGVKNDTLEKTVRNQLALEPNNNTNKNNVDASGCKQNNSLDEGLSCNTAILRVNDDSTNNVQSLQVNRIAQPEAVQLEEHLKNVPNNNVTFINLKDQQQLDSKVQLIQVQAPLDTTFTLYANGQPVSKEKIGKTATQQKQSVSGYDYYGVQLNAGHNTLRGVAKDASGNIISEQSIQVYAPEQLQEIDYRTQEQLVTANGHSQYQVVISLKDKDNRPYLSPTFVTIDSNIGRVNLKDESPDTPGIQTSISGGELLIPVIAPTNPGKGQLTVSAGTLKESIDLEFTPQLRPLIAVGVIDGSVSFKGFDSSKVSAAQDLFEQELQEFSGNDDYSTNGRAAMFLKGKVRGDYLLTLSYDSDKKGERLFRDIQPEEYYPVYGDASAKGFDAQSSSRLYVRLDKGRSYAMYGDINTQVNNDEGLKLGQYNRTLTGLKAQYEDDKTRVTAFAAQTNTSQSVNETRGLGISGPYPISKNFDNVLENSETVEVITRDADNPGIVISRRRLTRFADYEIDPISHSLYLKNPIPSQDFDGNPIYLQVTVEVDNGGEEYWLGGISAKRDITDRVSVGGSYVQSDNPENKEELASINSVINFSDNLKLIAEYARNKAENPNYQSANQINTTTASGQDVKGDAVRVELTYDDNNRTRAKAYYNDADIGFVTGSSPITAGRTESGASLDYRIGDTRKTTIKVEGVLTKDHKTDDVQQGIKAGVERQLTDNITAEVGTRYYKRTAAASRDIQAATDVVSLTNNTSINGDIINQSALDAVNNDTDIEGTTVRARVTARLPQFNKSVVFAEYEQDINHSHRNATSIGGETALGNMGRIYARHDLINSLTGSYGLDDTSERQRTVVGFDANYMKDGKVYSEYRSRDAISAREAEAAIGLKNKWYVSDGLTLNTLLERVESLQGESDKTTTAASIGAEYLAKDNYKASGRFEKRWGQTSETTLASAGIAYRYNEDITLLAKDIYSNTDYDNGYRTMNRFQVGAAYRDTDSNQLDMLGKVEYRTDDNATGNAPYERDALIWSWHGNYHPTRPLTLSGHYAGKHTQYKAENIDSKNTAHAAYVRGMYDLNERWDAGLQAGTYWNDQADDLSYMLGAEVGYSPITNLWLSLGYNFVGYQDEDIAYDDTTAQGAYFRMRFKFDENLFKGKDPQVNRRLLPEQEPTQNR
ncbi:DUF11 domain-containing protein [Psychrobacter sp. I-STPA6b]|uniref:DUF11 domain-containing protein n=1 Tax=Psychrobacter sp. I-STPA6b TaxID=2585718 RepID=UPI001D0CD551|nr:DUF11 domain-containing protein [Psychrobacter sp. I-STPA6b]